MRDKYRYHDYLLKNQEGEITSEGFLEMGRNLGKNFKDVVTVGRKRPCIINMLNSWKL